MIAVDQLIQEGQERGEIATNHDGRRPEIALPHAGEQLKPTVAELIGPSHSRQDEYPELANLGATCSVEEGCKVLGIGRGLGYSLAKRGAFPGLLRLGSRYRISTAALAAYLEAQ